jgi:hypothetical protein
LGLENDKENVYMGEPVKAYFFFLQKETKSINICCERWSALMASSYHFLKAVSEPTSLVFFL